MAIAVGTGTVTCTRSYKTRGDTHVSGILSKTDKSEINLAIGVIQRRSRTAGVMADVAVK